MTGAGHMTAHDYTRRYWGHDVTIKPSENGKRISGAYWGEPLHEGDYLILSNAGRTTRYRILTARWCGADPGDMYFYEAEFAPRTEQGA